MASITLKYFSKALGFHTEVSIVTPEVDKPLRVVYLLHGAWSDGNSWIRQCTLDKYAKDYNFMLVMPNVNNSFYHDLTYGPKYFTYVTQELPTFIASLFNISTKREDTFVCGLSMGGFGAMKCALNYPEKYAGAASMSGALDLTTLAQNTELKGVACEGELLTIDSIKNSENDLLALLEKHARVKTNLPFLHVSCGTEDFIYQLSVIYRETCKKLEIPLDYYEEKGAHEWDFWNRNLNRILEMFSKM